MPARLAFARRAHRRLSGERCHQNDDRAQPKEYARLTSWHADYPRQIDHKCPGNPSCNLSGRVPFQIFVKCGLLVADRARAGVASLRGWCDLRVHVRNCNTGRCSHLMIDLQWLPSSDRKRITHVAISAQYHGELLPVTFNTSGSPCVRDQTLASYLYSIPYYREELNVGVRWLGLRSQAEIETAARIYHYISSDDDRHVRIRRADDEHRDMDRSLFVVKSGEVRFY